MTETDTGPRRAMIFLDIVVPLGRENGEADPSQFPIYD